ncbi:MAG: hypothetical protein IT545_05845 [Rhodobacteraceae bacterium]|nr:hypothetical protein [Paracoccaceae bacterium]
MALRPALGLGARQRLALSPGLRMGLALLRLPAAELGEAVAGLVAENPFLVALPPRPGVDAATLAVAEEPGPLALLLGQLAAMALAPAVAAAAAYLAGCLDEAGYLDGPLDELARAGGLDGAAAAAALAALQGCEPAGVGARDLAECLLLQLLDRGWPRARAAAVTGRLDLVARGDAAALARALALSRAEAAAAIAAVRGLRPRPFDAGPPAPPLVPDLVAEPHADGTWRIRLARGGGGRVGLDRGLAARAAAGGFLADRRTEAEAFLAALRFRGRTLLAVGRALAFRQHAALALGTEALRPLTRAALAADLGLHPATVGRAVAGKAILARGRLWPLSAFFTPALPAAAGAGAAGPAADPVAAAAARRLIARLVAEEGAGAALSDRELAQRLHAAGVDIARRTVAKYRQSMRIPSSSGRARRRPGGGGPGPDGTAGARRDGPGAAHGAEEPPDGSRRT